MRPIDSVSKRTPWGTSKCRRITFGRADGTVAPQLPDKRGALSLGPARHPCPRHPQKVCSSGERRAMPAPTGEGLFGNDHAVAFAGSQGNFQLNVYKPVILHNVLDSIRLLGEAARSFNDRCAAGIGPNEKRIHEHLDNSLMLVTALNPHIGYEKAAQISLKAYREDLTLREAALVLGFVTAEQFDEWVRPEDMTHPLAPL